MDDPDEPTPPTDSPRETASPTKAADWPGPPPGVYDARQAMPFGAPPSRVVLDVGEVLTACGGLLARNGLRDAAFLATFHVVGVVVAFAPLVVAGLYAYRHDIASNHAIDDLAAARIGFSLLGLFALAAAVSTATTALAMSGVMFGAVESLEGRRVTFGAMVRRTFARALQTLATAFVVGVVVTAGSMAFVAPGIYAAACFVLAMPLSIQRRSGVVDAIAESVRLTEGHRFEVFVVALVAFATSSVTYMVLSCVAWMILAPIVLPATVMASGLEGSASSVLAALMGYGALLLVNVISVLAPQIAFAYVPAVIYARLASPGRSVDAPAIARVFS